MQDNPTSAAPQVTPEFSGQGSSSGPANTPVSSGGPSKTPFIAAAVILFIVIAGGVLMANSGSTTPAPKQSGKDQPLQMETFGGNSMVNAANAESFLQTQQAAAKYGLDQQSVNNSVLDAFASGAK